MNMLCLFFERTQYLQMDKSAHFWLSTDLAFIVTSIQCCHIPVRFQIFKLLFIIMISRIY